MRPMEEELAASKYEGWGVEIRAKLGYDSP